MDYLTRLKLSPVKSLADARFAAAAGFNYMGFCFDPDSPDFMVPIKAKEIIEWTSGAHIVGEFGEQDVDSVRDLSDLLQLDVVLVRNRLLPDELQQLERPVIKVINAAEYTDEQVETELKAYAPVVSAFQLEGRLPDEKILKGWCDQQEILLNLPHAQLASLVRSLKPFGVNLHPQAEEKTGLQEFDELQELLDALKA